MNKFEPLFHFPDEPADAWQGYAEHMIREAVLTALQEPISAARIREIVDEEIGQFEKEAH